MPKEGIEISLDDPDDQNNKPANQNPAIPEDSDVVLVPYSSSIPGLKLRESVPDLIAQAMKIHQPRIVDEPIVEQEPIVQKEVVVQKGYKFPEILVITLPTDPEKLQKFLTNMPFKHIEGLLEKFEQIADDEEFTFSYDLVMNQKSGDQEVVVQISKNPMIEYIKLAEAQNVEFLMQFPYKKQKFGET